MAAPPVYRPGAPVQSKPAAPMQGRPVVQRVQKIAGAGKTHHMKYGDFWKSDAVLPAAEGGSMIIELLEYDLGSAQNKVQLLINSGQAATLPMGFVIGLNQRVRGPEVGKKEKLGSIDELEKAADAELVKLDPKCKQLAESMEAAGIGGGAFPFAWRASNDSTAGYVFPFWEARSRLTLHAGAKAVQDQFRAHTGFSPVIRSMDGDVSNDPLFNDTKQIASKMTGLINEGKINLVSGGYAWAVADIPRALNATNLSTEVKQRTDVQERLTAILRILNQSEQAVRAALVEQSAKSIYWPEPNTYMSYDLRLAGAQELDKVAREKGTKTAQQGESTHYVKLDQVKYPSVMFAPGLVTQKPLKDYFGDFLVYFATAMVNGVKPTAEDVKLRIKAVRQTHLNLENIESNLKWHAKSGDWESLKVTLKGIVDTEADSCANQIVALFP